MAASLAELRDQVATLSAQLAALAEKHDKLAEEVDELRGRRRKRAPPPPPQQQHQEPITYREALKRLGGSAAIEPYKNTVADLVRKNNIGSLVKQQRYVPGLDPLYVAARNAHPSFKVAVEALAAQTGGRAVVPGLKDRGRAEDKARAQFKDAKGRVSWHRLTDIVRGCIVYRTVRALYGGLSTVVASCDVRELNELRGGYIRVVIEHALFLCEIQLTTGAFVVAKETTGHRFETVVHEVGAAIADDDVEGVRTALAFGRSQLGSGASESRLFEEDGKYLLHAAAQHGNADILLVLLRAGADPLVRDQASGSTPLHIAMSAGSETSLWALCSFAKARLDELLDATDNKGHTPLVQGYRLLWSRPDETTKRVVHTLARAAGRARVNHAIRVVDAEVRRRMRASSLLVDHAAAGDISKVRSLLTNYADPRTSTSKNGKTALAAAVAGGHRPVVDLLLEFGAASDGDALRVYSYIHTDNKRTWKWSGVACVGATLFCSPWNESSVLAVDIRKKRVIYIPSGVDGNAKWSGIAAVGTTLFCAPFDASVVLAIDARTKRVVGRIECGEGEAKWSGIAAVNDTLFCAPFNAPAILVISAKSKRVVEKIWCGDESRFKWSGIVAVGHLLFCAPYSASCVLVIDGNSRTVRSKIACGKGAEMWSGIAAVGETLFCAPFNASFVLVIKNEKLSKIECGVDGQRKWSGIAAVGKTLFCAPHQASSTLIVDAEAETVLNLSCEVGGASKWTGITAMGKTLFCSPCNDTSVLQIDAAPARCMANPASYNPLSASSQLDDDAERPFRRSPPTSPRARSFEAWL